MDYPKYQASLIFGKGGIVVVRTEDKDEMIRDVEEFKELFVKKTEEEVSNEALDKEFDSANETKPHCEKCGSGMTRKKGTSKTTGKPYDFFGCDKYPDCDGTRPVK